MIDFDNNIVLRVLWSFKLQICEVVLVTVIMFFGDAILGVDKREILYATRNGGAHFCMTLGLFLCIGCIFNPFSSWGNKCKTLYVGLMLLSLGYVAGDYGLKQAFLTAAVVSLISLAIPDRLGIFIGDCSEFVNLALVGAAVFLVLGLICWSTTPRFPEEMKHERQIFDEYSYTGNY